jgi:hypothetical protein
MLSPSVDIAFCWIWIAVSQPTSIPLTELYTTKYKSEEEVGIVMEEAINWA